MRLVFFVLALTAIARLAEGNEPYTETLRQLLESHRRIIAVKSDVKSSEAALQSAKGGWYPTIKATVNYGYEDRAGKTFNPNSNDFTVDQLLWNFGATNAGIKKADLGLQQTFISYETERQALLLEGLAAYIDLFRAYRTLEFAQKTVENIRKQTGMEESRVEIGSGLPTDVLQAKSQLAGAKAREARSEGGLIIAENRFRNVFNREPPKDLEEIPVPFERLPANLETALQMARERNYQLRSAQLSSQIAHTEVTRVRSSELYPEIKAVGQSYIRNDANGIAGRWDDHLIKIEANYRFNLGFSQVYAVDAAKSAAVAVDYRLQDTLFLVEQQVRNAWQSLITARQNAELLDNQARIASEFLRLAREERLLGHRSLIDVLIGETNLINAESDAASAEADVALATFAVLQAVSGLELDALGIPR